MKTAVYAATDIAFDTKTERYFYPKGALVQLELAPTGDVYVIHHTMTEKEVEKDDGKKENQDVIEVKNLKFVRMEDLIFALDSIVLGAQLSDTLDFKDVTIDDAIVTERIPPAYIAAYLVDETSPLEKTFKKDDKDVIRLPVRTLAREMSHRDKVNELRTFDDLEGYSFEPSHDILALTARTAGNVNETKYIVDLPALDDVRPYLTAWLEAKLKDALPKEWKIRRLTTKNEETGDEELTDLLRVYTINDPVHALRDTLDNIAATLPVDLKVDFNTEKDYFEVLIVDPELEQVLESFFTRDVISDKYSLIDGEENKEGARCVNENGDIGKLVMKDNQLVCVTREAYEPDCTDYVKPGDPCMTESGLAGVIKEVDGGLACVCQTWKEEEHEDYECDLGEADKTAGSVCNKGGQMGTLQYNEKGKLVCKVAGQTETVAYTIPKADEAISYDGYPLSPGASPKPGDPCDYQGKPGTLALINGALICALGGEKPKGADGAN